jgi:hypothetical protein
MIFGEIRKQLHALWRGGNQQEPLPRLNHQQAASGHGSALQQANLAIEAGADARFARPANETRQPVAQARRNEQERNRHLQPGIASAGGCNGTQGCATSRAQRARRQLIGLRPPTPQQKHSQNNPVESHR